MYNKKTKSGLEQELKRDAVIDREMDYTQNYLWLEKLMQKIEYLRQERQNVSKGYTQRELAEKSGIALSTYKDYLSGTSDNIRLKTIINIANVLHCDISDLINESITDRPR